MWGTHPVLPHLSTLRGAPGQLSFLHSEAGLLTALAFTLPKHFPLTTSPALHLKFTFPDLCCPAKSPPPTSAQCLLSPPSAQCLLPAPSAQCLLTKTSSAKKDTTHSSSCLGHRDADDDAAGHQAEGHTGQLQAAEVSGADGNVHAGLPRALLPGLLGVLVFSDGCLLVGALHPRWKLLVCNSLGC